MNRLEFLFFTVLSLSITKLLSPTGLPTGELFPQKFHKARPRCYVAWITNFDQSCGTRQMLCIFLKQSSLDVVLISNSTQLHKGDGFSVGWNEVERRSSKNKVSDYEVQRTLVFVKENPRQHLYFFFYSKQVCINFLSIKNILIILFVQNAIIFNFKNLNIF